MFLNFYKFSISCNVSMNQKRNKFVNISQCAVKTFEADQSRNIGLNHVVERNITLSFYKNEPWKNGQFLILPLNLKKDFNIFFYFYFGSLWIPKGGFFFSFFFQKVRFVFQISKSLKKLLQITILSLLFEYYYGREFQISSSG